MIDTLPNLRAAVGRVTGLARLAVPLALAGLLALTASPLSGQSADDPADSVRVTVLDGVFTAEQVEGGERMFGQKCAGCHAPAFFQAPTFVGAWAGRPVRSLYRRLRQTMPEDNPGSLKPREYAAVIAYILDLNGYPAGDATLPDDEEALRGIIMVEHPKTGGGS